MKLLLFCLSVRFPLVLPYKLAVLVFLVCSLYCRELDFYEK